MDKNQSCLVLFLVSTFLTSTLLMTEPIYAITPMENTWETLAPMQQARAKLGVVAANGSIYAIGGTVGSGLYPPDGGQSSASCVGTNEEYNISTNSWSFKAPMPTARDDFAIAEYQGKIYCIGGHISNYQEPAADYYWGPVMTTVNEVYDIATNTWETKAPMPVAGIKTEGAVVDGQILVKGLGPGYLYNPVNDSWSNSTAAPFFSWRQNVYDATNWIQINVNNKTVNTDMQFGAAAQTSGVNASKLVYVMGIQSGFPIPPKVNEVYNPVTDTWSKETAMPTLRQDFGLAVFNDVIYAIGGYVQVTVNGRWAPSAANERYLPIGYGNPDPSYLLEHTPPAVSLQTPQNLTFQNSTVPLYFSIDKNTSWIGYSLDGDQNVTVTSNITLTTLQVGQHNVTIYANDTYGNIATPQTITFTVAKPVVPFLTPVIIAIAVPIVMVGSIGILFFRRHRKTANLNK